MVHCMCSWHFTFHVMKVATLTACPSPACHLIAWGSMERLPGDAIVQWSLSSLGTAAVAVVVLDRGRLGLQDPAGIDWPCAASWWPVA